MKYPRADAAPFFPETDALAELVELHAADRLRLVRADGQAIWAHPLWTPHQLVSEVLHLAQLGALAREAAQRDPDQRAGDLITATAVRLKHADTTGRG